MYANAVQELIDELGRLPGVGPKSAQRIAFYLLKLPSDDALRLAKAITVVKERVSWCRRCFNIAESAVPAVDEGRSRAELSFATHLTEAPALEGSTHLGGPRRGDEAVEPTGPGPALLECGICSDPRRDPTVVCVVEEPRDVVALEKTREFRGRYHVLQGAISPIDGIGPDQLRIRELLARLEPEGITEVILCTNPNIEGDATALYLASLLKVLPVKVTRIASGLPVGGDLEYADELTLGRALEGRRELSD
jgi:recombination protein RecR